MLENWLNSFFLILNDTFGQFSSYLPAVAAALAVLLVGVFIAKTFKKLTISLFESVKLSSWVKKTPLEEFISSAEVGQKFEEIIGSIVYWLLMLVVLQTVVSILGLESLSIVFDRILGYIPNIISAVFVLFFGVLLAGLVESLIKGTIKSISGQSSRLLGRISSYLVVTITVMIAISELGIASEFIMILFVGFVATVSLGLGLALGLGGKDLVAKVLNEWYQRELKKN